MRVALLVLFLFLPSVVLSAISEVPRTGQITSYAAGDDGDIQAGLSLPEPRFTDNGDGTVTDNLTGLIWLKNAEKLRAVILGHYEL